MITIMEKYTEAVIQKKPELLPLAENVRATFNGVECAVGDNPMWKNTLVMPERQTFIDTVTGEMVLFGTTNNETVERSHRSRSSPPTAGSATSTATWRTSTFRI